jgi:hypothetical protein
VKGEATQLNNTFRLSHVERLVNEAVDSHYYNHPSATVSQYHVARSSRAPGSTPSVKSFELRVVVPVVSILYPVAVTVVYLGFAGRA